jgi:hypothetical protein
MDILNRETDLLWKYKGNDKFDNGLWNFGPQNLFFFHSLKLKNKKQAKA